MQETHCYRRSLTWIVFISAVIRCLVAYSVEFGNDEVYYFTYAVQPDWNHFDHPPLVGLFIRLCTLNLHWLNEFSVRLPAILGAAVGTWLIARCGQLLRSERTGLIAAVLYNTSLYTSIISGLFILPDSVQLVFWLAALYAMLKLLKSANQQEQNRDLLLLGVYIGLAIMSKVHGVFLWFGLGAYILFHERRMLRNPYLYISIALTLLIVSPIVFWNINNQFISWQFHSERVEANNGIDLRSFLVTSLGQIAYQNPVNALLMVLALIGISKGEAIFESSSRKLLLWCSLPIILATCLVSLLRPTLPHWSGPGFLGLILLVAGFIDLKFQSGEHRLYSRLLKTSAILIATIIIAGVLLIDFYPGTLNTRPEPRTGSGDFTLDMYGWKSFRSAFEHIREQDLQLGRMSPAAPLIVNKWFPGGHLYFYLAYPLGMRLLGVGPVNDLHKFQWLNAQNGTIAEGTDAYFISPSNYFTDPNELYRVDFQQIEKPVRFVQRRNGEVARYWYVYRMKGAKSRIESP